MTGGGWFDQPQAVLGESTGSVSVPGIGIIDRPTLDDLADTVGIPVSGGTFVPGLGGTRANPG